MSIEEENPLTTGFPRPKASYKKYGKITMLPVPWFATAPALTNKWASVDPRAAKLSQENNYRLCQVCGTSTGQYRIYAREHNRPGRTSGPGMHAKCALIALSACPHLKSNHQKGNDVFDIVENNQLGFDGSSKFVNITAFALTSDFRTLSVAEAKQLACQEHLDGLHNR